MGLSFAVGAVVLGCSVAGVAGMAQSQQQQQQASSHLGQVAKRHGGEEANPANGTTNNVLTVDRPATPGRMCAEGTQNKSPGPAHKKQKGASDGEKSLHGRAYR